MAKVIKGRTAPDLNRKNQRIYAKKHPTKYKSYHYNYGKKNLDKMNAANVRYYRKDPKGVRKRTYFSKAKTFIRRYANKDDMRKLHNVWTVKKLTLAKQKRSQKNQGTSKK